MRRPSDVKLAPDLGLVPYHRRLFRYFQVVVTDQDEQGMTNALLGGCR